MLIGVTNASTIVSSEDAYNMTLLVNHQLRHHAAPAFDRLPPEVRYFKDPSAAPAGTFVIAILDNSDQAGTLGYHTLGYGRVFAEPVLGNGGGVLSGELSVCSVLSHEVLESFGDLYANAWGDLGNGTCYAWELGDPVESDSYELTITAGGEHTAGSVPHGAEHVTGTVSDFVLPSWFDPDGVAPFDFLDLLTAPFEVRSTGYVIVMADGNITERWGEHYPEWRKATKASPGARTSKRHAKREHSGVPFAASGRGLPPGVELGPDGVISGVPRLT